MIMKRYALVEAQWETIQVVMARKSFGRTRSMFNYPVFETIRIGLPRFLFVLTVVAILLPLAKGASEPSGRAGPMVTSDALEASAQDISGRVVDPNGRPVAGAQVALATLDRSGMACMGVIIDPPVLRPITDFSGAASEIVETDAEGRFSFPGVTGDFMLVASHQTGFARVDVRDFTPLMTIRLESWGRIEGTLYVGRKPATGEIVCLDFWVSAPGYASEVRYRHGTRVGLGGQFVVPQVVPDQLWIGHEVRASQDHSTEVFFSLTHRVHVNPGETLKIKIGGTGRPVIGKFVLPEDSNRPAGLRWVVSGLTRMLTEPPKPAGYGQMTESQQRQWYEQWVRTPEGQVYSKFGAYWDSNSPSYSFVVNSDNRFRIEDVIPGRYELRIALENPAATGFDRLAGSYSVTVEVPPMREAYMDEPLDLGEVMLKSGVPQRRGDAHLLP